jgi:hypothetical protein
MFPLSVESENSFLRVPSHPVMFKKMLVALPVAITLDPPRPDTGADLIAGIAHLL